MTVDIAPGIHDNMHPRIATDGAGNAMVIWWKASDQSLMFSKWNGSAFTTPVALNPGSMPIAGASWMGPDIAAHGDTVYVVMKQIPETDTASHIRIIRSFDGGQSWSPAIRVDYIGDSLSRFSTVTTDDQGNPVVAFMKFNQSFGDARWVVAKSTDFGATFSTDVHASGWSSPGSEVCDCCPGSLLSDGSTSVMLYRDVNNNIRDTWAGISTNGGTSFTGGIDVDQQGWMVMMCPASGPDGIIWGDSLYTVFMSGASGTNRVYWSASSVTTLQALPSQPVTGTIPGLSQQNFPGMAGDGNAVAMVWKQTVSSTDQLLMRFTNDIAGGLPMYCDTVDLGSITNSDVALTAGNVFVAWQDDNSGTVKFRSGTFSPVNTLTPENHQPKAVAVFPNPSQDTWTITGLADELPVRAEVFNSLGQITGAPEIQSFQGSLRVMMKPYDSSPGIYFLKLVTGDRSIIIRLIKS